MRSWKSDEQKNGSSLDGAGFGSGIGPTEYSDGGESETACYRRTGIHDR